MKTLFKFKSFILKTLLIIFLFNSFICQAQQHNVNNISVPSTNGGGAMIGDIVKAGNYFAVYSSDKVLVFDENGNLEGEVLFNLNEDFGKFNPIYFWESHHNPSSSLMAYNSNSNVLYAVSPDLKIYVIDMDPGSFLTTSQEDPNPLALNTFRPLHGKCLLKYDEVHSRLYWLIGARHPTANSTGSFHVRQRYLFIYDIDDGISGNGGIITPALLAEHVYSSPSTYEYANISDIEFNRNQNTNFPDFFYLSKINRLEVWGIDDSQNPKVFLIDTYNVDLNNYGTSPNIPEYYKFGGLTYVHDPSNGLHKIIAFPYRFPGQTISGPDLFVLDGEHTTNASTISWVPSASPNQRITDLEYLPGLQHLILTHPADPNNTAPPFSSSDDVSIFEFSGSLNNDLVMYDALSTDNSPFLELTKDFNTPIDIVPITNSTALICKEYEISRIYVENNDYTYESMVTSENNFFRKGVSLGSWENYVLNAANNGIQEVDNTIPDYENFNVGYQSNHICMDNDGDKFYIYNKLNNYNTGCIVYDGNTAINLNNNLNQVIEAPIGDCIYNPFLNHFLISENASFDSRSARVKVFLNNAINKYEASISLEDGSFYSSSFAREMYISPEGKLYVTADMDYSGSNTPKVYIFDAMDETYPLLGVCNINNLSSIGSAHDFYNAHFCYNHHNNKVYATIHGQDYVMSPYNSNSNGLMKHMYSDAGLLLEFHNNAISNSIPLTAPGKIICPEYTNTNTQSRYGESLFIIGSMNFYEVPPPYTSVTIYQGHAFMDISYSPKHDMLFAFNDSPEDAIYFPRHRVIRAFSVDYLSQGNIDFNQVLEEDGQASCIVSNPYNGEVYIQLKTDQNKLGATPVSMLWFEYDPSILPPNLQSVQSVSLGINSLYPEIDHNDDYDFYLYNITTPIVNPYDNSIYFPNGAHSCISKVSFDAEEKLQLNNGGITWLSVPRHIRPNNNPTPIQTVFDPGNISGTLTEMSINYNFLNENMGAGEQNIISSIWDEISDWNIHNDNSHVYSTRGYIVEHSPNEQKTLTLTGDVESPDAAIDLYCQKDNWVGYFLYEEQSAFDALADVLDEIYHIKGQTFNCYRYNYPVLDCEGLKSYKDVSPGTWICNGKPNVNYGDMIMIKPEQDTEFQWNYSGNLPSSLEVPKAEYFEYDEKATYTTLVLELDTSTANPIEIGAFVNDTCVGACTVNEMDSVVVLSAYLDEQPGDSVTFEQHFASAKSTNAKIMEYFVLNNKTQQKEKRVVKTGEKQDIFIISFRDEAIEEEPDIQNEFNMYLYPNPATSILNIEYSLDQNATVHITLLDVLGRQMAALLNEHQPKGIHTHNWNVKSLNGQALEKGVYFVQLTAGGQIKVQKLIVN